MDYDKTAIAATYDAARAHRPEAMRQWLDLVAAHAPGKVELIVDVGCGTGRFTQPLSERFQARTIGIDPSQSMLASARAKANGPRVELRRAPAERLPLEDACADIVFMSMVLHHLPDRPAAARECRRVLRDGGRLCMRTCTRNTVYPQSRFFPGMAAMVEAQLPSAVEIIALLEDAGLRTMTHRIVSQTVAGSWREFTDKLALRADSFLARLPDSEFEAGMAALRAHADASAPEKITEAVDFFVFER